MCSVLETEPVEARAEGKKSGKRRSKAQAKVRGIGKGECMKCAEKAVILVRNGDPLCKVCFLEYTVHKFRATIGKARVVRQGEKVLLACSGGSSSSAMLDLVVRGLSKEAVKKLRFQPGVVCIDEGELFGRSVEERKAAWESVKNTAEKAGFLCHLVSLEEIFLGTACIGESMKELDVCDGVSQKRSTLVELFNNVDTLTAKEDLLDHFHRWQFLKVAKEHGYDRVMVGDCSTNLSVRILSGVAQGRASQLPFNIGFEDTRSEISILRPMREFTKKEIEFYSCFNEVISFSTPSFSTKASPNASINRLTQEFLFGLQATFPSTVSTVLRTGDKLTSSDINTTVGECCSICSVLLESNGDLVGSTGSGGLSSGSIALTGDNDDHAGCSGGLVAGNGDLDSDGNCDLADHDDGANHDGGCCISSIGATDGCCGSGMGSGREPCCTRKRRSYLEGHVSNELNEHLVSHFSTTLCYGCKLTYKELNRSQNLLPIFVTDNASKMLRRTAMKEEIKEFLIDD